MARCHEHDADQGHDPADEIGPDAKILEVPEHQADKEECGQQEYEAVTGAQSEGLRFMPEERRGLESAQAQQRTRGEQADGQ